MSADEFIRGQARRSAYKLVAAGLLKQDNGPGMCVEVTAAGHEWLAAALVSPTNQEGR